MNFYLKLLVVTCLGSYLSIAQAATKNCSKSYCEGCSESSVYYNKCVYNNNKIDCEKYCADIGK